MSAEYFGGLFTGVLITITLWFWYKIEKKWGILKK